MSERLRTSIKEAIEKVSDLEAAFLFEQRLSVAEGLTRDEDPAVHFCVYFAAYDLEKAKVFIGHHKKSGLWLFNGGHIDAGECVEEALLREIGEEWGVEMEGEIVGPEYLSVTEIENPEKQTCRRHFDIWYFIPVREDGFAPSEEKLLKEFYTYGWYSVEEALTLAGDPNTRAVVESFGRRFGEA